jgi:MerR family transcriptional regulator, light-induced transcriptional regulator
MSYRIKRVAHLTGINPATLRAWERRYNLIAPGRTNSGYRLYTDEDVAMLTRIKRLTDEGLTIGEAIARVRRACAPLPTDAQPARLDEVRRELREALFRYDRADAQEAYERLAHLAPERRVEEVLLPMMREVGEMWHAGDALIAQEHFCSAFVREKVLAMIGALEEAAPTGPEAVCAGVPGELHELGLMGAALRMVAAGWRVTYLGANLPLDEMRRVVRERKPAVLATSVVMPREKAEFRALCAELRDLAPRQTAVVIGGGGVPYLNGSSVDGVRVTDNYADLLASVN